MYMMSSPSVAPRCPSAWLHHNLARARHPPVPGPLLSRAGATGKLGTSVTSCLAGDRFPA